MGDLIYNKYSSTNQTPLGLCSIHDRRLGTGADFIFSILSRHNASETASGRIFLLSKSTLRHFFKAISDGFRPRFGDASSKMVKDFFLEAAQRRDEHASSISKEANKALAMIGA